MACGGARPFGAGAARGGSARVATPGVLIAAAPAPGVPNVPIPQQPGGQPATGAASDASKTQAMMAAVAQIVAQVVEQVIAAVISAGGWGGASDAQELTAAAVAAIISAEGTIITQLPTLETVQQQPDIVLLREIPAQIASFQQQNRAAGKPQANLLTAPQIDSLLRRVSMASATHARLANDLKALLGRLPRT